MRGLEMMIAKVEDSIRKEDCLGFVVGLHGWGEVR